MVSTEDIADRVAGYADHGFVVHDGYAGWSYGAPLNPTAITLAAAEYQLNHALPSESPAPALVPTPAGFPAVQFAEEGDALYERSGGNRFVEFTTLARCLVEPGHRVGPPVDFGLGQTV